MFKMNEASCTLELGIRLTSFSPLYLAIMLFYTALSIVFIFMCHSIQFRYTRYAIILF